MPLPKEILKQRLEHEIAICRRKLRHEIVCSDETFSNFPVQITVNMKGVPAPVMRNGILTHRYNHKFLIEITDDYPYQKPIIRWQTDIFHPNIMIPEDGGYVCTKLLDDWDFSSNLLSFFKGIESLLCNPNPSNPYGTDSCTRAAEYFYKHPDYKPPMIVEKKPTIGIIRPAGKEEKKDDQPSGDAAQPPADGTPPPSSPQ